MWSQCKDDRIGQLDAIGTSAQRPLSWRDFYGGKYDCLIMESPIIITGLDLSLLRLSWCLIRLRLESCCYRLFYGLIDYSRLGSDWFCSFVDSVAANSDCGLSFLFQQKTRGTLL